MFFQYKKDIHFENLFLNLLECKLIHQDRNPKRCTIFFNGILDLTLNLSPIYDEGNGF